MVKGLQKTTVCEGFSQDIRITKNNAGFEGSMLDCTINRYGILLRA